MNPQSTQTTERCASLSRTKGLDKFVVGGQTVSGRIRLGIREAQV